MITGPVGIGKSTLVSRLAQRAVQNKLNVAGVLSPRIRENDKTMGYNITDLVSGRTVHMAIVRDKLSEYDLSENDIKIFPPDFFIGRSCRYHFIGEGIDMGNKVLHDILEEKENTDVIIIDELGFLELNGEGLFQAVALLQDIGDFHGLIIILVRDFLAAKVKKFLDTPFDVIEIGENWEMNAINEIWSKYFVPMCKS